MPRVGKLDKKRAIELIAEHENRVNPFVMSVIGVESDKDKQIKALSRFIAIGR